MLPPDKTPDTTTHLVRYIHDVTGECTEIWCENVAHLTKVKTSEDIAKTTCKPCLEAAGSYGRAASRRWTELDEAWLHS